MHSSAVAQAGAVPLREKAQMWMQRLRRAAAPALPARAQRVCERGGQQQPAALRGSCHRSAAARAARAAGSAAAPAAKPAAAAAVAASAAAAEGEASAAGVLPAVGSELTLRCARLGSEGKGICLLPPSGLVVMVRGALPGELLTARVAAQQKGTVGARYIQAAKLCMLGRSSALCAACLCLSTCAPCPCPHPPPFPHTDGAGYIEAVKMSSLEPHDHAVAAPCPHFGLCGGCTLQVCGMPGLRLDTHTHAPFCMPWRQRQARIGQLSKVAAAASPRWTTQHGALLLHTPNSCCHPTPQAALPPKLHRMTPQHTGCRTWPTPRSSLQRQSRCSSCWRVWGACRQSSWHL